MKAILILLIFSMALVSSFGQGGLTPPGAPAPTMKTLDQLDAKIERRTPISSLPFTISAPGSYVVTSNLTSAGAGITISANDVTVDLNGFNLTAGPGGNGVRVSGARTNICVRNGSVSGCTTD